jgi:hypothetical protein
LVFATANQVWLSNCFRAAVFVAFAYIVLVFFFDAFDVFCLWHGPVQIPEIQQLLICSCFLFDVLYVFIFHPAPAPLSPTEPGLARPMGLSLAELGWPNGPTIPSLAV